MVHSNYAIAKSILLYLLPSFIMARNPLDEEDQTHMPPVRINFLFPICSTVEASVSYDVELLAKLLVPRLVHHFPLPSL